MKLIDILEVINESNNVKVLRCGEVVTEFDGKNSIDESFNKSEVFFIDCTLNGFEIHIR